jgi:hypothetical protein
LQPNKGPEHDAFWQRYFTNKTPSTKGSGATELKRVYRAAVRLCHLTHPETTGDALHTLLRQYIFAYYDRPYQVLKNRCKSELVPSQRDYEDQTCLVTMAILNEFPKVAISVLEETDSSQTPLWQTN